MLRYFQILWQLYDKHCALPEGKSWLEGQAEEIGSRRKPEKAGESVQLFPVFTVVDSGMLEVSCPIFIRFFSYFLKSRMSGSKTFIIYLF